MMPSDDSQHGHGGNATSGSGTGNNDSSSAAANALRAEALSLLGGGMDSNNNGGDDDVEEDEVERAIGGFSIDDDDDDDEDGFGAMMPPANPFKANLDATEEELLAELAGASNSNGTSDGNGGGGTALNLDNATAGVGGGLDVDDDDDGTLVTAALDPLLRAPPPPQPQPAATSTTVPLTAPSTATNPTNTTPAPSGMADRLMSSFSKLSEEAASGLSHSLNHGLSQSAAAAAVLRANEDRIISDHLGGTGTGTTGAATTRTAAPGGAAAAVEGDKSASSSSSAVDHPLGEQYLPPPSATSTSTTAASTTTSNATSASASIAPITNSSAITNTNTSTSTSTSSSGNLKSQAKALGSWLSDVAVQAGSAVAHAAAQADMAVTRMEPGGGGHGHHGGVGHGVVGGVGGGQHYQQMQMQAGGGGAGVGGAGVGVGVGGGANQPYQQHPAAVMPTYTEMDNAQKSALITSALTESESGFGGGDVKTGESGEGQSDGGGEGLITGERVIMFLSHLSNVRDSGGDNTGVGTDYDLLYQNQNQNQYSASNANSANNANNAASNASPVIWCCAVTFYRVVLFSFRECDFEELFSNKGNGSGTEEDKGEGKGGGKGEENEAERTNGNDNDNDSGNGFDDGQQLDALVRTASVSRQFQASQSTNKNRKVKKKTKTRTRRHHVLQMPLSSIDRVERSSEYAQVPQQPGMGMGMGMGMGGGMASSSHSHSSVGIGPSPPGSIPGSMHNGMGNGMVSSLGLILYGKDNGRYLRFTSPSYADAVKAHEALLTYAFPGRRNLGYLFAFESRRVEVMSSIKSVESSSTSTTTSTVAAANSASAASASASGAAGATQTITARATPRRYEALREFERQGILQPRGDNRTGTTTSSTPPSPSPTQPSPWKTILKANGSYSLCPSYPSILIGPRLIDDDHPDGLRLIRKVAAFRSEGRMPTLSWGSRIDGASIWRSGQPRVGLQGNRSSADERYLRVIAECAASANAHAHAANASSSGSGSGSGRHAAWPQRPTRQFLRMLTGGLNDDDLLNPIPNNSPSSCRLKIMDLRPKSSAIANRTQGYGYENTSYYPGTDISFYGIGNVHAVRDSYQKISALCQSPASSDVQWHQHVEDTKWLSHVRLILSASWQTAFHVRYNRLPVLLHCSHGWDRTSQVAALAELLLDPYYRTRVGFSTLVEKDFMALGHPFHTRCGHGEGKGERGGGGEGIVGGGGGGAPSGGDEGQISQIFIQFLDCVFQLVNQYPEYFEFNARYLLLLSEHVYSCRFGTLLCDTERERELVAGIRQRTNCLWEYLDSRPDLVNPFYRDKTKEKKKNNSTDIEDEEGGALMMPLPTLLRNVTLWVDRHCMYGPKPTVRCMPSDLDEYATANPVAAAAKTAGSEGGKIDDDGQGTGTGQGKGQPLHVSSDANVVALQRAVDEAAKWKSIAEARKREVEGLQSKLDSMQK